MVKNTTLVVLLAVFAFLHLHRMGELSFTWDEGGDLTTVNCLQRTHNPFACTGDISQTRLPFYLHALAGSLHGGSAPHFLLSFAFSLIALLAVYAYTLREHGALAATIFAALYVTAPQLLASGRMVVSHSSIIFTAFTTLSLLALFEYARTSERRWLIASAICSGAAAGSSVVAAFNAIFIAAYWIKARLRVAPIAIYVPIAAITFFVTTIVYFSPAHLRELIDICLHHGGVYPHWNYLGLGITRAPWFFPFLLIAIKVGPWLVFAFHREARWFLIALFIELVLKGFVFRYETPHHQVQFYPLLYMYIAIGIVRWWRPWVIAVAAVLFAIQVRDVVRFFPNYLFWGAQYGERFIGEFYGPAVIHGQGRNEVWPTIDRIRADHPDALILVADNNAFEESDPHFVPFTRRDPKQHYEFALVDRLYATHFTFPERDAYNELLAREYTPVYTTYFPPHVWVYRVLRSNTRPQSPPARPSS